MTLDGVNIDVSDDDEEDESKAAVSIWGKGNVTIELDNENTIKSGENHAGLEKRNVEKHSAASAR